MRAIATLAWHGALAVALACALAAAPASAQTRVSAALRSTSIEQGESTLLTITVQEPQGTPEVAPLVLARGLAGAGPAVARNYALVNGVSSSTVQYTYELRGDDAGRYSLGPFRVRMAGRDYVTRPLVLVVRRASDLPARLYVEVQPREPYVGQLVQVAERLVQFEELGDAGDKAPPPMPGFWAERFSDLFEYRGRMDGRPVGVVESRARIYPLAAGYATIGRAHIAVSTGGTSVDPLTGQLAGGRILVLHSDSLTVRVKPLPEGAPAGFAKAIGAFGVSWALDRGHASQDQALQLQLDVRGIGNLPLLPTPAIALEDFEVFASTVDDSFAPPGDLSAGRRRFQWTLVPRRAGLLRVPPVPFAWFDPAAGSYRSALLPELSVEVLAAAGATAAASAAALPPAIAAQQPRPGARGAWAWAFALAGACVGFALRTLRGGEERDPLAAERARQGEFLRAVGFARGGDFWRAADEAVTWAETHGQQVLRLREEIAAARYGGAAPPEDGVRARVVERVSEALPPLRKGVPAPVRAAVALALGLVLVFLGAPRGPEPRQVAAALRADQFAREHRIGDAEQGWRNTWREAPGDAAIAARLAHAALQRGDVGEAAVWVMRGRRDEPRQGGLDQVAARVRDAGGLVGAPEQPLPLRSLEWAAIAFALALGAALEWPRRWSVAALGLLALAAAGVPEWEHFGERSGRWAVVVRATPLAGADVDLEAGQVVRTLGRRGALAHVRAGHGLAGDVPADALRDPAEHVR
ncbi:MAG: BatD family protein [Candidatus Eisenbacteria bacterium]|uniref:BatD family protein n=1 Tax=Eiseniibacteriota bacterium TaxID=2212470 RepID=A0A933SCS8_UNCEI|nr:BatD family protein [Candidatus Eisenbacteria bacterium]